MKPPEPGTGSILVYLLSPDWVVVAIIIQPVPGCLASGWGGWCYYSPIRNGLFYCGLGVLFSEPGMGPILVENIYDDAS